MELTMKHLAWIMLLSLLFSTTSMAAQCTATSGDRRVALLELYTSEGCDSCPPTDRWVSSLPARGFDTGHVLPLAFHVDYWNYLGWADPFAQQRYTERQRYANARIGQRTIYTPQLMLDGKDYRPGTLRDDFADKIAALNAAKPDAQIMLSLNAATSVLDVTAKITTDNVMKRNAQTYLALQENRLANQVTAGENRGKRLAHDFVVRELAGPLTPDAQGNIAQRFTLDPKWKTRDLSVVAFVQDVATGSVLQALALPYCN